MRTVAATLGALVVLGCTAQLTRAGSQVHRIQPDAATRCRFLGAVAGSHANGASVTDNELGATNELRNRVAQMGGNAFVLTHTNSNMWRSVAQADAYLCPSWEPVPGLPPL